MAMLGSKCWGGNSWGGNSWGGNSCVVMMGNNDGVVLTRFYNLQMGR